MRGGWRMAGLRARGSDRAESETGLEHLDRDIARIRLRTGGWIDIDRYRRPGGLHGPRGALGRGARSPVPGACSSRRRPLARPRESPRWRFAVRDRAWGIIGDRMGGKSSLLAALAQHGSPHRFGRRASSSTASMSLPGRAPSIFGRCRQAARIGENIGVAGARRALAPPIADRSAASTARRLDLRGLGAYRTRSCASRPRRRWFDSCETVRPTSRPTTPATFCN